MNRREGGNDSFSSTVAGPSDFFNSLLGYKFNSVEISRELYSPKGHAAIESDQAIIRQGLAKVFRGELSVPMDVKSFPFDTNFAKNQMDVQKALLDWLGGKSSPKVTTEGKGR